MIEAVAAIAELGLPANLLAVVPATENMPSGHAIKPGDIITQLNGKTVEVNNTDAEGRLILADALAYAVEDGAERLVDLATLTGAVLIALGSTYAALISNDDEFAAEVAEAAERTGELAWRLPLHPEYKELTKGTVADLTNASEKRKAGTIYAASFLEEFVDERPVGPPRHRGHRLGRRPRVRRQGPDGLRGPAAGRAGAERLRARRRVGAAPGGPARGRPRSGPGRSRACSAPCGRGPPWGRGPRAACPLRVGTVAKWTMSGRLPAITRSGLRRSPSSITTVRGRKLIRSGEKSSRKRKTIRPRIRAASSGSRAIPRSIRPRMLGATPSSTMRPRRTRGPTPLAAPFGDTIAPIVGGSPSRR